MDMEHALRDVSDDRLLGHRRQGPSPIGDLINRYNEVVYTDDSFPQMTAECTGRDLKDALAALDEETLPDVLGPYIEAVRGSGIPWEYQEAPRVADERRFRIWLAKFALVVLAGIVFMMIGIMMVVGLNNGVISKNPLITSMIEMSLEIMHVIFS